MTAIGAIGAGYQQPVTAFVQISDTSAVNSEDGTASTTYTISSAGTVTITTSGTTIFESWLRGSGGVVANYEASASRVSGQTITGLGVWTSCSSSPSWTLTNSAANNSTKSTVLTVSIRDVATHTVQDTATVTLSAESTSF